MKKTIVDPEYKKFHKWFKRLLYKTDSCFERDALRTAKMAIWDAWKAQLVETK